MELFSELYSCYYQVVAEILRRASVHPLSRAQICALIDERAFSESGLYLLPQLCEGDWPLLSEDVHGFSPYVHQVPELPLTNLQTAWLKSILLDPRARLFLTDVQLQEVDAFLGEIDPLFSLSDFQLFDQSLDGDSYTDCGYRERFMRILQAIRAQETVRLHYLAPGACEPKIGDYLPYKLEYSQKDDRFRLYAAPLSYNRPRGHSILNLGRVIKAESSRQVCKEPIDFEEWINCARAKQPVQLRIFRERNALERCMLHFASYEKRTEYDEQTDSFLCWIYYNSRDETELLIRILSFGPVIQVLGPKPFLHRVQKRVREQYARLFE